jgi:propionyl-CoA carboxylase alpha chain
MHVRMADEAYNIGPPQSKDSYLRMDKILDVAKKTGAQGIHPGYGFLSENAKFADMVEAAGIAFIGPSSAPMNAMGDKINSKKIAKEANCFVIPGYEGEVADEDAAARLAKEVGYPVMIKASAGGGGKGMRVAYNEAEVREGFRLSKSEALSSFGDDRMLIERFIEDPHHIEIQVVADTHGNVIAFPERECSVQRRNQKVVEESPSCLLTPATRRLMQEQAIALCKKVGYRSAGTVEMLCDGNQNFYFLEMNTRLQVEHPITELVSGEDLVEHMLRIAAGEPLPARLLKDGGHIPYNGWAIESRVYAEDPLRNFLPSIGPLINYKEPPIFNSSKGIVRLDTGVYEGGVISMYYDPMIAKLCTHAKTRLEAIKLMEDSLDHYVVHGLGNNIPFLRSVYRNKNFRDGNYSTKFIAQEYPDGFKGVELKKVEKSQLIAMAVAVHQEYMKMHDEGDEYDDEYDDEYEEEEGDDDSNNDEVNEDDVDADAEFVVVLDKQSYVVKLNYDQDIVVSIEQLGGESHGIVELQAISSIKWNKGSPLAKFGFDNDEKKVTIQYEGKSAEGYHLRFAGAQHNVIVRSKTEHEMSKHMLAPEVKDVSKYLLCPMPGTLISCSVTPGQKVEIGQQLAVVEAMKMQNVLRASKAGVVKSVNSKAGSHLKVDQVIIEFESEETMKA